MFGTYSFSSREVPILWPGAFLPLSCIAILEMSRTTGRTLSVTFAINLLHKLALAWRGREKGISLSHG